MNLITKKCIFTQKMYTKIETNFDNYPENGSEKYQNIL